MEEGLGAARPYDEVREGDSDARRTGRRVPGSRERAGVAATPDRPGSPGCGAAAVAPAVAGRGAETVRATIQGMDQIREQIQETAKRIAQLVGLLGIVAQTSSHLAHECTIGDVDRDLDAHQAAPLRTLTMRVGGLLLGGAHDGSFSMSCPLPVI